MRIEIIDGQALNNGAKAVPCIDCRTEERSIVDAAAVLVFGRTRIPLCVRHLLLMERNLCVQLARLCGDPSPQRA